MELNEKMCKTCRYRRDTFIFQLCTHPHSEYVVSDKRDFHTRRHMLRSMGGNCAIYEVEGAKKD